MVLGRWKGDTWGGQERRAPAMVLIVNSDPDACEMLVRMVGSRGHRAIGATTGDEATGRIVNELPRCVVLDLDANGIGTSLKVLDTIRSHDDLRVSTARVVLCALSAKNRSFSYQSGADGFVVRPFHVNDLVEQISTVLTRANEDRPRHRRDEIARYAAVD